MTTGIKAFWYITLPNLKRTITVVVVLQIILHFQVFGQSHLMTNGGPNDTTQVLVRYIYQTAFRDSELGRASAMATWYIWAVTKRASISSPASRASRSSDSGVKYWSQL